MPARLPYLRILLLFVVSRLFIVGAAFLSRGAIEPGEFFGPPNHWIDYISRWDASWYLTIAYHGYSYTPGVESNVAFFPFYPLLLVAFSWAGDLRFVGLFISNVCLLLAAFALWKVTALRSSPSLNGVGEGDRVPDVAVALFLFNPVSLFYSIGYTESTFILLAICSVLAVQSGRLFLAFLAAYAAALTRSTGLILVLPLLIEYYRIHFFPFRWERRLDLKGLLLVSAPILGVASFALHLYLKFGDPLLFSSVQRMWKRSLVWPWLALTPTYLKVYAPFYLCWFLFFLTLGLLLIARGLATRIRWSYSVMGVAMVLLYLSSGRLESIPRYLSVIFPLYIIAAELWVEKPAFRTPIAFVGGICGFLSVALFVNGYWFT